MLITAITLTRAQEGNPSFDTINYICTCSTHSSMQFKDDYINLFNPHRIKNNHIKELIVYNTTRRRADSIKPNTFKIIKPIKAEEAVLKFRFSSGGRVVEKIWYYMGIPIDGQEFKRDANNNVIQIKDYYPDSFGRNTNNFPLKITDLTYNKKNLLIKKKVRNARGIIDPDSISTYSIYDYDSKGRKISEMNQTYYLGYFEKSVSVVKTKISEESFQSVSEMQIDNNVLRGKITGTYDSAWKIKKEFFEYDDSLKTNETRKYFYNNKGDIIRTEVSSNSGREECPEQRNFTEDFFYDHRGMLMKIEHTYGKYTCELRFEYK